MKITILSSGTRGDVQPYIALGKALQNRGHDILLVCPDNFSDWIRSHGLAFCSLGVDMETFIQSPEGKKVLSGNPFALIKIWKKMIIPIMQETLRVTWESARDADVIVCHPKVACAVDVAEATGATLVSTAPFPLFPTKAFPLFLFRGNFGPGLNLMSYKPLIFSRLFFLNMINHWRKKQLGLGKSPVFDPAGRLAVDSFLQLCMVSSALVQYPDDSSENVQTTGYWFLEEGDNWQPDTALEKFLKAGDTPVYVGFGSMPSGDPGKLTRKVIEGLRRADVRAIIATGWGGLEAEDLPESIFMIDNAPHDALFRHVQAVVHHGGAGTTAAGLRAGLPTFICYLAFDQPYWGRRIWSLGCGPKPLSLKRLTAKRFAKGLTELTRTASYRKNATAIARAIGDEDGVMTAVKLIEDRHAKMRRS